MNQDSPNSVTLNQRAVRLCQRMIDRQVDLRVKLHDNGLDSPLLDCGVEAAGSLEAGLRLAEICMAGLGRVTIEHVPHWTPFPQITVRTDNPARACLASQYAGWRIESDGFWGMASGPMRAAAQVEELYKTLGFGESDHVAVGVIESSKIPPPEVRRSIAQQCEVATRSLTLLVAPTNSLAGILQIVARSVETSLHKLHELQFDVECVRSAMGSAPLPPCGANELTAMGRSNDAILYGAQVTLWCDCDDQRLEHIAPLVPSCASRDFGRGFAELYSAYDGDFYKIDKLLFSPAAITLVNMNSGRIFSAGTIVESLVRQSFAK